MMWRCNDVWYGFAFIAPRLGFNLKMNGVFELLWTRPIVGRLCWELEMNGRLAFGFSRWNWCLISTLSADLFWVVADYHLICVFVSYIFSVGFYVGLFLVIVVPLNMPLALRSYLPRRIARRGWRWAIFSTDPWTLYMIFYFIKGVPAVLRWQ